MANKKHKNKNNDLIKRNAMAIKHLQIRVKKLEKVLVIR
jgi:hypothetical protein